MTAVLVLFVVLLNQGYFCLKTLNFENLKYVERTRFYYFSMNNVTTEGINVARKVKKISKNLKTYLAQNLPDHFIICSSQHTSIPDSSMIYYIPDHNGNNFLTLRLTEKKRNSGLHQLFQFPLKEEQLVALHLPEMVPDPSHDTEVRGGSIIIISSVTKCTSPFLDESAASSPLNICRN